MSNELTKEFVKINELAVESFTNLAASNVEAVNNTLTTFVVNPAAIATATKSSIRYF